MKTPLASLGFFRLAVASPELRVADVAFNTERLCAAMAEGRKNGCRFFVFPELCVTGYSCGDLFFQPLLLDAARAALRQLAEFTGKQEVAAVVGAPLAQGGRLFNCAVVISCGRLTGVVPKTFLPNTQEFYEERWFSPGHEAVADFIEFDGEAVPFGTDLLFRPDTLPEALIGVEICEDAWVASPPSGRMAVAGATVLLNLSASPEQLGKHAYRRALVEAQSGRCLAAYAYASAGPGESSTDLVFSGHSLIAENGVVLAETERFSFATRMACRRRRSGAAGQRAAEEQQLCRLGGRRPIRASFPSPFPRSPSPPCSGRCRHPLRAGGRGGTQSPAAGKSSLCRPPAWPSGCATPRPRRAVIGVSGGLDSTLALLVTVKAFDPPGAATRPASWR